MTARALPGCKQRCVGFVTNPTAEAQTDLATVRDAMEATDEALARKEQEAAYMVDGEI